MRPVILASVFLVVTCFCEVLSVKLVREQPSRDSLKLTSKRKTPEIFKRRVRRDANKDDHPDVFNVNKVEGPCNDPTEEDGQEISKLDVSLVAICFVYLFKCSKYKTSLSQVELLYLLFSFSGSFKMRRNLAFQ